MSCYCSSLNTQIMPTWLFTTRPSTKFSVITIIFTRKKTFNDFVEKMAETQQTYLLTASANKFCKFIGILHRIFRTGQFCRSAKMRARVAHAALPIVLWVLPMPAIAYLVTFHVVCHLFCRLDHTKNFVINANYVINVM